MTEKKKFSLPIAKNPTQSAAAAEPVGVMADIAAEIKANTVVLYMKGSPSMPQCGFSARAAAILTSYSVPIHHVDVLQSPEKRHAIKEFSDWPTIPQVYVGGEFVGGSDILIEMHENGELGQLIGTAAG
jgi:monothiol glutaredoxin